MEEQDLYHFFVDFKKSFDRVCHEALWSFITLYNNNANLIRVIENLYNKATSAVCLNGENRRLVQNHSRMESDKAVCSHRLSSTSFAREL